MDETRDDQQVAKKAAMKVVLRAVGKA